MKNRIDRAVATLRGYCRKVNCKNCRYRTKDNVCHLLGDSPCEWDPERWQREREREDTENG